MALPKNRFRHWITCQSFLSLMGIWSLAYILIGAMFATLYNLYPEPSISGGTPPRYFLDFLHFSFTTQATVGYGDYYPVSILARFTAALQGIVGTALAGLILGIATFKLIKRGSPVSFPEQLVYDPKEHTFWFRFVHYDADSVRDLRVLVTIFHHSPGWRYDTAMNHVAIDYHYYALFSSAHLVALRTISNKGEHTHEVSSQDTEIVLSPLSCNSSMTIRISLAGYFNTTGDTFFAHKDYSMAEVVCGRYDDVDNFYISKLSLKKKARYIEYRFNKILRSSDKDCLQCPFLPKCPLDPAPTVREQRA